MIFYYRDEWGNTATITENPDGTATQRIMFWKDRKILTYNFKTVKGAKTSLSRKNWHFREVPGLRID